MPSENDSGSGFNAATHYDKKSNTWIYISYAPWKNYASDVVTTRYAFPPMQNYREIRANHLYLLPFAQDTAMLNVKTVMKVLHVASFAVADLSAVVFTASAFVKPTPENFQTLWNMFWGSITIGTVALMGIVMFAPLPEHKFPE